MSETMFEPLEPGTKVFMGFDPAQVEHDGGGILFVVRRDETGEIFGPLRNEVTLVPMARITRERINACPRCKTKAHRVRNPDDGLCMQHSMAVQVGMGGNNR